MADWRARTEAGATARIRAYYDVIPDRESRLTLDGATKNAMGDPMPRIDFRAAQATIDLERHTHDTIRGRFDDLARRGRGSREEHPYLPAVRASRRRVPHGRRSGDERGGPLGP